MSLLARIQQRAQSWWSNKPAWGSWSYLVPSGNRNRSGQVVTPDSALTLAAAFAAINVIATDTASFPLCLHRKRKDGGSDEITDDPRAQMMAVSPDGETTSLRFRQDLMGHVLGWGNGYAEIEFDDSGVPTGLYVLDPNATNPERIPQNRRLFYRTSGGRTLPPYRVLHFAGLGYDGLKGYSPITLAKESIGLGLAAEAFGCTFFGNGTWPGLVLESPQKLSKDSVSNLREQWEELHRGGDNSHRVAVLEMGMKASRVTINPEDAQFLETRKFQVVEVARIFRLPPHKIGDYSQSHLANIEASNLDYASTVLTPWCRMVEQQLDFKLLTEDERRAGFYFQHDMTSLLRGDSQSRANFYAKLRDLGAINPNEIRAKENLDPIEGGDVYLVPMNMTPLSMIEEQAEAALEKVEGETETGESTPEEPPDAEDESSDIEDDSEEGEDDTQPEMTAGRSRRFNQNRHPDGKFASDGGGSFDSHPDVVGLKKDHAGQVKEMESDHAKERKQQARDQDSEVKSLDRDQAREKKELDREQQRESKSLAKEQTKELAAADGDDVSDLKETHAADRSNLADDHKTTREMMADEHKTAKQDLADQHEADRKSLAEEHADSMKSLKEFHQEELAEVIDGLKAEASDE
jgi:HK97 family phage portal protein